MSEGRQPVTFSAMRKAIARRMVASKQEAPHFYVARDLEMDAALDALAAFNEGKDKPDRASVTALLVSLARNVEPLVEPLRGILDAAARAHARDDRPLTIDAPGAAAEARVASEEDPTPRATPEARVPEETAEATPDRTRAGTRDPPPRALAPHGPASAPSSAPGPVGDRMMKLKLKAFGVQLVRRRPLDAAEAELSPGPSPECGVAVPVARVAPGRPPSKLREADHRGQAR